MTVNEPVRVMIVEDSPVLREFLENVISQDPRLNVVGSTASAEEALDLLSKVKPDVISMDIRLPGMDGLEATRRIMRQQPTPIVVLSASVDSESLQISMGALRAGALAVLEKPPGAGHADYREVAENLCTQLYIMSQVKVVRQRMPRYRGSAPTAAVSTTATPSAPRKPGRLRMVGMAASTGGPKVFHTILNGLPADFPLPILLVQHMGENFMAGFATWLDSNCPQTVVVAKDGDTPSAGTVYVAPGDRHLALNGNSLRIVDGEPVCGQRPSASVLFESMARALGPRGLGVVLTGMGEDGADGLLAMRRAGGFTIAEEKSTAIVYGMPAAAVDIGAACVELPLHAIAGKIVREVTNGAR